MADVKDPCPTGHTWNYATGKCTFCDKDLEQHKATVDHNRIFEKYKCDCGAEAAGFTSHAHWCKLAGK